MAKHPLKLIIPSVSLGRVSAGHELLEKLEVAAEYGYYGIECTFECLEDLANRISGNASNTADKAENPNVISRWEKLHAAARRAQQQADSLQIRICVLQAFHSYEGLIDESARQTRLEEATLWVSLARVLGAETIQVPSNALEVDQCSGNVETIVSDLQTLADLGVSSQTSEATIRFAYENMEWSTHIATWQDALRVVELVDRPNFGLCIDTCLLYGDPTAKGGRRPQGELALSKSLEEMKARLPVERIFLFQLSDADLLDPPLPKNAEEVAQKGRTSFNKYYDPTQRPGLTWSRNARPFPFTTGYLPVAEMARTVYSLGYSDISSMEVFTPLHHSRQADVPKIMAQEGVRSWQAVLENCT